MAEWFVAKPVLVGVITFFLMWIDWLLTIAQEKERVDHYYQHYQSYPTNTIEGNPILQSSVSAQQIISPKHLNTALIVGTVVGIAFIFIPQLWRQVFLGYVWGLFFIVITQHLTNLLGYRAARQGISGKIWMHQRVGLKTQAGRYFSLSLLLGLLAFFSASQFIIGVTIAGLTSALRQILWMRKVPKINDTDAPPEVSADNSIDQ